MTNDKMLWQFIDRGLRRVKFKTIIYSGNFNNKNINILVTMNIINGWQTQIVNHLNSHLHINFIIIAIFSGFDLACL